jgi:hypothetical protein
MVKVLERFMHNRKQWTRYGEDHYEQWCMGVDLGQRQDHTAISAIQHTRIPIIDDWTHDEVNRVIRQQVEERFAVRGLQRLPLDMDCTLQGQRIKQLLNAPPLNRNADLVIDDTGVGAPVCDQVIAYGGLHPVRVTLTGNSLDVNRLGYRRYSVPKLLVVSHLDARFGTGDLVFAADLSEREAIKDELVNFQRHITAAGRSTFEARSSKHDDIVISVALALWWCMERRRLMSSSSVVPVKGLC